jgi:hypothetical protein
VSTLILTSMSSVILCAFCAGVQCIASIRQPLGDIVIELATGKSIRCRHNSTISR